jgi:hypothetical protein
VPGVAVATTLIPRPSVEPDNFCFCTCGMLNISEDVAPRVAKEGVHVGVV